MSGGDEDDKPTVVLDLAALKKQKLKQEEDLANIGLELEFAVDAEKASPPAPVKARKPQKKCVVLLFDLQSDFFSKSKGTFPADYDYKVVTSLPELNQHLRQKETQIAVFNYDVNPKAVNQLCAQIKQKFPHVKTMIMAKSISAEKAKIHSATPGGAHGYYQFPLETSKIEKEFQKIQAQFKQVS
jgi:hypothetical protein